MVSVITPRERRAVARLGFCYFCGQAFKPGERRTDDHVPPKSIFAAKHRDPLVLHAHAHCNGKQSPVDERIGQLIALRRREVPDQRRNRKLRFLWDPKRDVSAVTNVDIYGAVQRWIRGFHAALYREPVPQSVRWALQTPFVAVETGDTLKPQHLRFVQMLKTARAAGRLDQVHCNKGQLRYECVWQTESDGAGTCIFGLDVCDWKDLGKTREFPARGCAGVYTMPFRAPPPTAVHWLPGTILVPSVDGLDPFGR